MKKRKKKKEVKEEVCDKESEGRPTRFTVTLHRLFALSSKRCCHLKLILACITVCRVLRK